MKTRFVSAFILSLSVSIFTPFSVTAQSVKDPVSRHKALCSQYSDFTPCEIFISHGPRIYGNLPNGYLDASRSMIISVELCDADVHCFSLAQETIAHVWDKARISPFAATVDYRLKYFGDGGHPKTAIFRFYNRTSAEQFGSALIDSYK